MTFGIALDVLHIGAFVGAVATLFLGHVLRAVRWRAILRHGHITISNFSPLVALSMGYIANAVLPFRLGEGIRALSLAYIGKIDFVYVIATIIFERLLDLVIIGVCYLAFVSYHDSSAQALSYQSATALFVILCALLILHSKFARGLAWRVASVFNTRIKTSILHFLWSWAEITVRSGVSRRPSFWLLTLSMWAAYGLSLFLMAAAVDRTLQELFAALYVSPLQPSLDAVRTNLNPGLLAPFAIYLFAPLVAVTIYYLLFKMKRVSRADQIVKWVTDPTRYVAPHGEQSLPRFTSVENYAAFLDRKFRGEGSLIGEFETRAIGGATVHRLFHGGSAAVTALVEIESRLRVRKFAAADAADKLDIQRRWLIDHSANLPLVQVLGSNIVDGGMYYDMAYSGGSRDLYEAIHSEPLEVSRKLLDDVVAALTEFHSANPLEEASEPAVRSYVLKKVCANLKTTRDQFPEFFSQPAVWVNGRKFDNSLWSVFASPDWMTSRLTTRTQGTIHGDLTVENILLGVGKSDAWFLIDPNPENGFESPLIDFAKIMQSLHLGYESLNRDARAAFAGTQLQVHMHRSQQYHDLHTHVVERLAGRFGEGVMREIYLHEIVNYFRLIPYQFRRSHIRGEAFVGALCLLILDHRERYADDWPC